MNLSIWLEHGKIVIGTEITPTNQITYKYTENLIYYLLI